MYSVDCFERQPWFWQGAAAVVVLVHGGLDRKWS